MNRTRRSINWRAFALTVAVLPDQGAVVVVLINREVDDPAEWPARSSLLCNRIDEHSAMMW